jgi:hypothetical protein
LNNQRCSFPLFGRGGHPFLLDQKGRKNQGKTNYSARFPKPRAQHRSKWFLLGFFKASPSSKPNSSSIQAARHYLMFQSIVSFLEIEMILLIMLR